MSGPRLWRKAADRAVPATRSFIVSGCASGIGKHMALALARGGHSLMLLDINDGALNRALHESGLADSPRIVARAHDVRDAAGWERIVADTVDRFGALDVMLNIAGCLKPGYVAEMDVSDFDRQIDVNAKGVMYATRAGARQMVKQGYGHIVNVASLAGISHVPGLAAYCASKHAVRGFSLAAAHELAPKGVHVSVVCPDAVETPMLELQTHYEEAAMTFGGGRGLTLQEVEHALFEVLDRRPLEHYVRIPRTGRTVLAQVANLFPEIAKLGVEQVISKGRKVQQARRSGRV